MEFVLNYVQLFLVLQINSMLIGEFSMRCNYEDEIALQLFPNQLSADSTTNSSF